MKKQQAFLESGLVVIVLLGCGYPFVHVGAGISDIFWEGHGVCVVYLTPLYALLSSSWLVAFWRAERRAGKPWITRNVVTEIVAFALVLCCLSFVLAILSRPYVLLLNSFVPPRTEVDYSGIIENKYVVHQRFGRNAVAVPVYYVVVQSAVYDSERKTDRIRLPIFHEEYTAFDVDDEYEAVYQRGGLGITYLRSRRRPRGRGLYCLSSREMARRHVTDRSSCREENWRRPPSRRD